jgi:hypothetical protein
MRLHLGCKRGLSETSFHHRRASLRRDGEILIRISDEMRIFSRFDGGVSGDAVEAVQVGMRLSCGPATTMPNCSGLESSRPEGAGLRGGRYAVHKLLDCRHGRQSLLGSAPPHPGPRLMRSLQASASDPDLDVSVLSEEDPADGITSIPRS